MAASSLLDVVRFLATAGSTTDWTVSSAVQGYQTPTAAGATNGAQYSYRAESADLSQWEVGIGTWTSGTSTLSRTTVLFNSSGTTSKISFSAAPQVAVVALKEDLAIVPTVFTNALSADVSMTSSGVFVDGPSVTQGSTGTFLCVGKVLLIENNAATFNIKLWDGTTVIDGAAVAVLSSGAIQEAVVMGVITNPAGNIKISCCDTNGTPSGAKIRVASGSGNNGSSLTVVRIG